GEVDQVDRVAKDGAETRLLALLPEPLPGLGIGVRRLPRAWALGEELQGVGAHPDGLLDRRLHTARAVRADQHQRRNSERRAASSSASRRTGRGRGANGASLTLPFSWRHVPATTPSTR